MTSDALDYWPVLRSLMQSICDASERRELRKFVNLTSRIHKHDWNTLDVSKHWYLKVSLPLRNVFKNNKRSIGMWIVYTLKTIGRI